MPPERENDQKTRGRPPQKQQGGDGQVDRQAVFKEEAGEEDR